MGRDSKARQASFLQHLEPLQGALEAFCRRCVTDRNEVRDVLQSAIAAAYRDFDEFAEGTCFSAWMFRYLHFEVLNRNRKSLRDRHLDLPEGLAADEAWQLALDEPSFRVLLAEPEPVLDMCDDAVAAAVREMPAMERAVLLLRAIGEFKYREIAEILEIPIGSVMGYLSRGRLRLRHRLVQFAQAEGFLSNEVPQEE